MAVLVLLAIVGCGQEAPASRIDAGPIDAGGDADAGEVLPDAAAPQDAAPPGDAGADEDAAVANPCGEDDEVAPAVVIGRSGAAWGDMDCEETVLLDTAGQGAYHFFVSIKQTGVPMDRSTGVDWSVERHDGSIFAGGPGNLVGDRWDDLGGGWYARFDQQVETMFDSDLEDMDGTVATVTVRVFSDAVEVTDTHRVRFEAPGL